jgi:hypothetical protein
MKAAALFALLAGFFGLASFGGRPLRPAHWGGSGVEVAVQSLSSKVELSCGNGTINEPFFIDRNGRFDLAGTYESGPVALPPPLHPAHYIGSVEGKTMRLTIRVDDTAEMIGPFQLTRGVVPVIIKCL